MNVMERMQQLGKAAAAMVGKTVRISLKAPGARKQQQDALHADKSYNAGGPWRQGRKPTKRKPRDQ